LTKKQVLKQASAVLSSAGLVVYRKIHKNHALFSQPVGNHIPISVPYKSASNHKLTLIDPGFKLDITVFVTE
jgi:hypothetical protein